MNEPESKISLNEADTATPTLMPLPGKTETDSTDIQAHLNKLMSKHKAPKPGAGRLPMPGFAWNPLLKLPRNSPCPCRSGKKFKKCCIFSLVPVIPQVMADNFAEQMKKPDLVFLTKKNQEQILKEVEEKKEAAAHCKSCGEAVTDGNHGDVCKGIFK